jgi:hypothetical protein
VARALAVGDAVFVPCSRLDGLSKSGVALYKSEIVEVGRSKVRVRLSDGSSSDWIGASLVHRDVGILVLSVGDFETESTLLNPLAKSVTQFCRLLLPDDQVRAVRVRSLSELRALWQREQAAYSHVVWIGHGSATGINFGVDGWVDAQTLGDALRVRGAPRKVYISLCCKTGYKSFGSALSRTTICSRFVGPFHSVEGAVASQFCQTFLTAHLLEGRTVGVAFNKAGGSVPGGISFRLWTAGRLKAGPRVSG